MPNLAEDARTALTVMDSSQFAQRFVQASIIFEQGILRSVFNFYCSYRGLNSQFRAKMEVNINLFKRAEKKYRPMSKTKFLNGHKY